MDKYVRFYHDGKILQGKAIESTLSFDTSKLICNLAFEVETVSNHSGIETMSILQSGNRTIVFWDDGTKTIVKRAEDESDNPYEAFTAALAIKIYGSNSKVKSIIDHNLKVQERSETGKMEVTENYEIRKRRRKNMKKYIKAMKACKEINDEQKSD